MSNQKDAAVQRHGGGEQKRLAGTQGLRCYSTTRFSDGQVAVAVNKRGKKCVVAKLVRAEPLGELVLAVPYRHRQTVNVVSLPPMVLAFARQRGARLWIVRLDGEGRCLALPLSEVERRGWLKMSDGQAEWFVNLNRFEQIDWQDWPFVEHTITLGEPAQRPRQLTLWGTVRR